MKKALSILVSASLGGLSLPVMAENLADVYNQAKNSDPTLLRSAAQRDAAFESVTSSRSTLLPQINLTAGYNVGESYTGAETNAFTAGIGLSQELYQRSSWVTLETAEKNARQSDSAYAAQQQDLILRVATAYFEVLRAQDSLEFVQAEKSAVERQLDQEKQRFEVGLSAITNVHEAQAEYDSVLAEEVIARNNLVNSYETLREITGIGHKNLDILDIERFSASKSDKSTDALVEQAQLQNLSLLAARISQDIARDDIRLASSGHLPSLTFNADAGYANGEISGAPDLNDTNYNLGINLSVPLYTGGSVTSQVKQAEYNYVAVSEDLEASYRSVVKTVRASNNNIDATIGSIRAFEQSLISAESALAAVETGYEVGSRTIVDVLDFTRRVFEAQRNLSDARYNYIISVLQLKQAVGTLNEQDILEINNGLIASKKDPLAS
ncbi:outer membrane channel protein TolC [Vibrio breoganii]|uniref:outer membrane channel protein TolC n=1 Tax=Vibrio breoganii TaxID=553239 RepID=UPI000C85ACA7|nr:outer membrane channel protein TolC [Vibrio breoganii]PMG91075.1 outer membrane channel protein TolC [Vibrio breoganii]PMJ47652.1 outer membrane channel protein TolC [Vibrio breoganii]PMK61849.1 outer membrane channel protein TolC [Vibrio breoganii]PMM85351.1 outer membrane channel protein TolC [Vibrio breoganii]PMO28228.1 outer membrane channel protein TolC [Vibrio breoganii]